MTAVDLLITAVLSLRANILRSGLTTLGIIIGVAAVIAMVAVGAGAERRLDQVIQSLGSNILIVLNGTITSGGARTGWGSKTRLTVADARAIRDELPSVRVAAPSVSGTGQVVFGNTNWLTTIYGITDDYLQARDWQVASGRDLTGADERAAAKVTLVGTSIVRELFAGADPIGQTIRIKRVPFTVVGVLAAKGQTPMGRDQDDTVLIPLSTAKKRVLGGRNVRGDNVGMITVKADTPELLTQAQGEITDLLRQRHRIRPGSDDDFFIRNITQMIEARTESERTMSFLLAAVAGVSLIVGGIGIMNIMLVSVTERTREIGLRMAVGARGKDILTQFVLEAVAMSLIGGTIGILVGVGGSLLAAHLAGWQLIVVPEAIVMAIAFSGAVGVFFGYYPALKASRLDPIEALRHE